ncbi:protein kinase [Rhodococcus erythropolis]
MGEYGPRETQRYPQIPTLELRGAGFDDVEEIGRGGFGVVYRCTETALDRTVAVKLLTVDLDEENRSRFFREQRAMGRLTGHPNIVNVLHIGATENGLPYIVMPYHPCGSVDRLIGEAGPFQLDETLRLGVKIAGAVETAHRLGILHRDIKPSNILLTDYGEPELADFGIARVAGGFETATGAVTGSPAYTAPEVLEGGAPSSSTDIYGLSATLFSVLTGHAAFERRSGEQVIAQFLRITTQSVPDLRERGVPDDVSDVIARGMARTPELRPPTAADFGEELRELQRGHGFPVDEMALSATPGSRLRANTRERVPQLRSRPSSLSDAGRTGNPPLELTSFVGRRHEVTRARNLLSRSRLVTLTGIGGVGKTRMAIRVARIVKRDYAEGTYFVELGELHDAASVVEAVAVALGVRDQSTRPLREVLAAHITGRSTLLVFDNCEQVIDEVASLAGFLLQECARLRILATSREPLGLTGEAVLRVPPLSVPDPEQIPSSGGLPKYDAVTLFAERGAAAVPGFEITDGNSVAIAGICQRLDGLPLPIELAAARLRVMSTEQILQRLTNRFSLLARGNRDLPTRQQTLRLCIDWSFELCNAREQMMWGRLSVFAGSFELDAAEQVCGFDLTPDEILDVLESLTEKSILIREEHGTNVRFRVLETLRDYGQQKLKIAGDDVALRCRHRDWYLALTEDAEAEWIGPEQLNWISRLKREQSNLRESLEFSRVDSPSAGLRIVAGLFLFWSSQGLYNEGRRWTNMLLGEQTGPPTLVWVKSLYTASVMANVQGDLEAAARYVEKAHDLVAHTSDSTMHAFADFATGMLALYKGEAARAVVQLKRAADEFVARGDRTLEVASLYPLGLAYELSGESVAATNCHERVLTVTKQHGEKMYRSHALWALGIVLWQQGDDARAVEHLVEALELTRQVRSPRIAASAIEALAWIASESSSSQTAAVLLGAAEGLARSIGSVVVIHSNLLEYHQNCEQTVREGLGGKVFEAAHRRGLRFTFDDALSYALGEELGNGKSEKAIVPTGLTRRELQVADLVAEGLTNRAIADRLVISLRTAQGHVEHILTKLGYSSRAQIAAWVVERSYD